MGGGEGAGLVVCRVYNSFTWEVEVRWVVRWLSCMVGGAGGGKSVSFLSVFVCFSLDHCHLVQGFLTGRFRCLRNCIVLVV